MGDMNSDPLDGDSVPGAMDQLLDNPSVDASVIPISSGAVEASTLQDDNNATHQTDALTDTADFGEASFDGPGNLRVDYVLPSKKGLNPVCGGVFWPKQNDKTSALTGKFPFPSSDHRLVWMDIEIMDTNPALCTHKSL